ncbi:sensor histidine kinase [Streptomyces sp. NPDC087440]|uniref:sensor histidine kinase n=1 Tax=Streptomyces sp. NPDC087440 TaxID=3365790 RepID=UPI0038140778
MSIRPPVWAVDAAIVAVAAAELITVVDRVGPVTAATYVLAVCALVLRRRWPLVTLLATLPAAVSGYLWLAPMTALGTAAAALSRPTLVYGCAVVMFLTAATPAALAAACSRTVHQWAAALLGPALFSAGPTALGRLAHTRRELAGRLAELSESRQQERRLVAEKAVATERARMAHEMHDVVSHQVSLIAMEAGVLALTSADPQARSSGERIGELGGKTLDELHTMLGVLRGTGDGGLSGLADLPALIAASGLAVQIELRLPPRMPTPPPATEHAAYRIIQEALTNAAKHAPGSAISIVVSAASDCDPLRIEVVNGPPVGPSGTPAPSAGHGLLGARERAGLLGGTVTAGPTPDGGFMVRAELPRGGPHRQPDLP